MYKEHVGIGGYIGQRGWGEGGNKNCETCCSMSLALCNSGNLANQKHSLGVINEPNPKKETGYPWQTRARSDWRQAKMVFCRSGSNGQTNDDQKTTKIEEPMRDLLA